MFNMTYSLEFHQPNNFTFTGHTCYWPILHVDQHYKDKKLRCDPVFRLGQLPDEEIRFDVNRCYETSYHDEQHGFRRGLPQCEISYSFRTTWHKLFFGLLQIALWITYTCRSSSHESWTVFCSQAESSLCDAYDKIMLFITPLVLTYGPPAWSAVCWIGRHINALYCYARYTGLRNIVLSSFIAAVVCLMTSPVICVFYTIFGSDLFLWAMSSIFLCLLKLYAPLITDWYTEHFPAPVEAPEDVEVNDLVAPEVSQSPSNARVTTEPKIMKLAVSNTSAKLSSKRSKRKSTRPVAATPSLLANAPITVDHADRDGTNDGITAPQPSANAFSSSWSSLPTSTPLVTIANTARLLSSPTANVSVDLPVASTSVSSTGERENMPAATQVLPTSNGTNPSTASQALGPDASTAPLPAPPVTPIPGYRAALVPLKPVATPQDTSMMDETEATPEVEPIASPQDTSMTDSVAAYEEPEPVASPQDTTMMENTPTSRATVHALPIQAQAVSFGSGVVAPVHATPVVTAPPQLLAQPQAPAAINHPPSVSTNFTMDGNLQNPPAHVQATSQPQLQGMFQFGGAPVSQPAAPASAPLYHFNAARTPQSSAPANAIQQPPPPAMFQFNSLPASRPTAPASIPVYHLNPTPAPQPSAPANAIQQPPPQAMFRFDSFPIVQPTAPASAPAYQLNAAPVPQPSAPANAIQQPPPQAVFQLGGLPVSRPSAQTSAPVRQFNAAPAPQSPVQPNAHLHQSNGTLVVQPSTPPSGPSTEEADQILQINQWMKEMDSTGRSAVTEWLKKTITPSYAPAYGRPREINYDQLPACSEVGGWQLDLYDFLEGEHKRSMIRADVESEPSVPPSRVLTAEAAQIEINQRMKEMDSTGRSAVTEWLKTVNHSYAPAYGLPREINYDQLPPFSEAGLWQAKLYEFVETEHKQSMIRTRPKMDTPRRRRAPASQA